MSAVAFRVGLLTAFVTLGVGIVQHFGRPLAREIYGADRTAERVDRAFSAAVERRYDWLLVGNSRVYRGVNPARLPAAAFNFAYDADSFNQVYYKLMYLERHGSRFRVMVMGVDHFQFGILSDARNFVYGRYLGADYLRDYAPAAGAAGWIHEALHPVDEEAFNVFMISNVTRPAAVLMARALAQVTGDRPPPPERTFLRDNGQLVVDRQVAHDWDVVRRDAVRLPIQVDYFRRSLEWAKRHGVATVLVMPPLRDVELTSYQPGVVEASDTWLRAQASEFGARYLNYSRDPRFGLPDFADTTHLTEAGADKFSDLLGQDLGGTK